MSIHSKRTEQQKESNRVYMETYRKIHRDKICEWLRKHRLLNIEKYRERARDYYYRTRSERRENENARKQEYKRLHPEVRRNDQRRRRALKFNAVTDSSKIISSHICNAPNKCYWCGKRLYGNNWHMDHVIPLSKGGSHTSANIVKSCVKCNTSKGNKLPHEWTKVNQLVML
jgi:5-methylcytosine-specific restriction endonuclease McrA